MSAAGSNDEENAALIAPGNYSSYLEFKHEADATLESEKQAGWLEWAPDLASLEQKHGPTFRSRIGVIAKEKQGRRKIRLVHDLRRSGVNSRIKVRERVVLPRLTGVVDDARELMAKTGAAAVDYMTADFKDAFKQLKVNEKEQRYLGGEGLRGFFVYVVVLFGIKSGPLLWCRVAAFLMRLTAAVIHDTPTRLECFVDDPILIVAGSAAERAKKKWMVVMVWRTLGSNLSWTRERRGQQLN